MGASKAIFIYALLFSKYRNHFREAHFSAFGHHAYYLSTTIIIIATNACPSPNIPTRFRLFVFILVWSQKMCLWWQNQFVVFGLNVNGACIFISLICQRLAWSTFFAAINDRASIIICIYVFEILELPQRFLRLHVRHSIWELQPLFYLWRSLGIRELLVSFTYNRKWLRRPSKWMQYMLWRVRAAW